MGVGPKKYIDIIDNMFNYWGPIRVLKEHFGGQKHTFKRKVWAKGNEM
jgi:hypothetical protein